MRSASTPGADREGSLPHGSWHFQQSMTGSTQPHARSMVPNARGAPIVSFVRINDTPIKIYSQIKKPDMVVVLDASVMDVVDVLQGLKSGGKVLVNSAHKKEFTGFSTSHVDLTGIALRENLVVAGSPILNTPVLGALAKMGIISVRFSKKVNP